MTRYFSSNLIATAAAFISLSLASLPANAATTSEPAKTSASTTSRPAYDIDLSNYQYPYPVSFFELNSQQHAGTTEPLKMAYMDVAPTSGKSNGKTVVLMHGKNFNSAYWRDTIKALTSAGYRVIAPDQISFGKSTKPIAYQYSFQQLANNTKQLLDSLGIEKASILGHSMGGMLATRFSLMFSDFTQQLILVNPIGLEDWKTKVPYASIDAIYKSTLATNYEQVKQYQLTSYYDNKWQPGYDEWVNLLAGITKDKDYPRFAWNAALTADMIFTQPVVYEFGQVSMPTLLIIGTRDRSALGKDRVSGEVKASLGRYDLLGKQTAEAIPNAKLVELDNVGHMPHIETFDRFIEPLVSFLDESK
ncbi:alpha/beta fold hydrolase [Pseudomonas sp. S9]|uniref:alpha/beta fold hydrolase n=1 Tax=Pseudomonas sp. S9 TaxID=686578 RepID=UPI0002557583|nr:alpha/beta hydrolase [Pseudomonas sp. S9]